MLMREWVIRPRRIYCEANRAAGCLANPGHAQDLGLVIYCDPPHCLCQILRDDASGVPLPTCLN